jgi:hypothetical protein
MEHAEDLIKKKIYRDARSTKHKKKKTCCLVSAAVLVTVKTTTTGTFKILETIKL